MDEIVEEYKKNNEHRFQNLLARLSVVHLLVIGAIILIAFSMSKNTTDPKYNYIIYGILFAIIILQWLKPSKEKKILSEDVAKKIAQRELDKKVAEGKQFNFDDKVIVSPYCHLVWKDSVLNGEGGYVHWDIGFEQFVHGKQYKKTGVISVHCYEGHITGIKLMRFGYDGTQSHDITEIPVGIVQGNIKPSDFTQK